MFNPFQAVINMVADMIANLFWIVANFFLMIVWVLSSAMNSGFNMLSGIFGSHIFYVGYINLASIVTIVIVTSIVYNKIMGTINQTEQQRQNKLMLKSGFSMVVLLILPYVLSLIFKVFNAIANVIFSITHVGSLQEIIINSIILTCYNPTQYSKPASEITKEIINSYQNPLNFTMQFDPTERVSGHLVNTVNWFGVSFVSIIFIIIIFILFNKMVHKMLETFELSFFAPISVLSFTKEGGVLFTRTIMSIISNCVSLLIVLFTLSVMGLVMAYINSLNPILSILIFVMVLSHAIKGNSKLSQILETDGSNFSSGMGLRNSIGNQITSSLGSGITNTIKIGGAAVTGGTSAAVGTTASGVSKNLVTQGNSKASSVIKNQSTNNSSNKSLLNNSKNPSQSNVNNQKYSGGQKMGTQTLNASNQANSSLSKGVPYQGHNTANFDSGNNRIKSNLYSRPGRDKRKENNE